MILGFVVFNDGIKASSFDKNPKWSIAGFVKGGFNGGVKI